MMTSKYIVAGIVRPSLYESGDAPRIWLQCGHAGPVFFTEQGANERARELNATTDEHSIRNAQAIQLRRDDYAPY